MLYTWPGDVTTVKVPGHSKLDFLEVKENHLINISTKYTVFKGAANQISVLGQRHIPPNTTKAQKSAPEKEKLLAI